MQQWFGKIRKMHTQMKNDEVDYNLPIGDSSIDMNELIGKTIDLKHSGNINCIHCDRKTKKSFNQGYCFVCLRNLARCDTCIIKPELCHYSAGTCREPEWGEENCLKDHFVYLANTGQVKVGITRFVTAGVSSRWMDQGATQALPIFRVRERLISGLVETEVAKNMGDKTNWRLMLKGESEPLDLNELRQQVYTQTEDAIFEIQQSYGLQAVQTVDSKTFQINYPVTQYPKKIKSINLDKEKEFSGELMGIKGQYLLLDQDRVINMRKYSGYEVEINAS